MQQTTFAAGALQVYPAKINTQSYGKVYAKSKITWEVAEVCTVGWDWQSGDCLLVMVHELDGRALSLGPGWVFCFVLFCFKPSLFLTRSKQRVRNDHILDKELQTFKQGSSYQRSNI